MGAKITVKSGNYSTGKQDRDAPKRKRRTIIICLICNVIGNAIATQYIASVMGYHDALGWGIKIGSIKVYPMYKWFLWFLQMMQQYTLQNPVVTKMLLVSVLSVAAFTFAPAIIYKAREKERRNRAMLEAVHGSARWADIDDIRDCGLMPPKGKTKTGAYVGGFKDPRSGDILYLKHDGPEHILAYAPTRSGKGVGLVLPTLLNWPYSCIVLDIKGENYALTAGWRKNAVHKDDPLLNGPQNYILKFDPLDTTGKCARYNPLNEIRLGTDYEHADIENLSMMLADPTGKGSEGSNAHWVNTSSSLLICLIYHMLFTCYNSGKEPTLEMLRTMFTAPAPELNDQKSEHQDASEEAADAFKEQTLKPIMTAAHNPPIDVSGLTPEDIEWRCEKVMDGDVVKRWPTLYKWTKRKGKDCDPYYTRFNFGVDDDGDPLLTHPKAAENANEAYQRNSKEAGSVLSTAANALKLYADPTISKNLRNATFRLYDLMNADHPVTLYLVVPPAQLSRLIPIMRIMITQVITILADKMRFEKGQTKGNFKHKMLLMLDEFPTLGNMEIFETSLAFIAGYGLKAYLIIQDLKQLYKRYTKEESIQSNCHVQVMYVNTMIWAYLCNIATLRGVYEKSVVRCVVSS